MANEFKVKKGLIVEGSGGTILDIQGSQGQLFSVTDDLTGDLFQVSDISGDPILNVNSSGLTTMEDLQGDNATFSGDAVINGGDLSINGPSTTYNSRISLKGYEPYFALIKTRGSSGDDTFKIKHENDTSAVDFALAANGGSDVRTARIGATGRWVIGGHAEVNSSQLSVQGTFGTTGAATFGGSITASSSSSAQLQVSGWSDSNGANNANGSIYLGNTAAYRGIIDYDAASSGSLIISNTWNNDAGNIIFKTKTAGTDVVPLTLSGSGVATFAGNIQANGGIKVVGPSSHNTIQSANDYTLGLNDSDGTSQWWIKAYTNGSFALHENGVSDKFTIAAGGNATFAGTIAASNFSGSHSGASTNTNTGDQTLPTDFVSAASGGTFGGAVTVTGELEATSLDINGAADVSGIITSKRSINFTTAIANSYVKILQVSTDSSQLASVVRLSATGHGGSHVGAWSADILVNHSQDITVKSQSGNYTLGTIKIQSNGNGEYHVLFKSTSGTSTTYYFTADSLTHTCTMSGNPTSTPSTTSIHEHVLNFGTNFTQQDNGSLTNGKANFGCEVEATSLDINGAADISGNVSTSGSFVGNSSYHEFGNGTGSVSNDGGWNGRLNVAGTSHARIDVKDLSDGIITTMYAHTGHATGKIGTMSNHSSTFMCNGNNKGSISTGGTLTMTGDVVAYSDKKLKENVKTLDGSKVLKMRGVSFDRIDTGVSSSGVIAQEMQEVAPELVSEHDGTLGVSYGNITGYLIEAIKEQQKQIDELKKLIKDGNNL